MYITCPTCCLWGNKRNSKRRGNAAAPSQTAMLPWALPSPPLPSRRLQLCVCAPHTARPDQISSFAGVRRGRSHTARRLGSQPETVALVGGVISRQAVNMGSILIGWLTLPSSSGSELLMKTISTSASSDDQTSKPQPHQAPSFPLELPPAPEHCASWRFPA